ncbi:hypothetical protein EYF80_014013 [Liparis tanakae]|uniref:Uncharacterized protein n=1 Tax=Liparis tanakae TaxID=230148 RepID=A0A4Z2ICI6_9TELE|nr:hypothetical protein EYF80_014013 [Liparis tanakae]
MPELGEETKRHWEDYFEKDLCSSHHAPPCDKSTTSLGSGGQRRQPRPPVVSRRRYLGVDTQQELSQAFDWSRQQGVLSLTAKLLQHRPPRGESALRKALQAEAEASWYRTKATREPRRGGKGPRRRHATWEDIVELAQRINVATGDCHVNSVRSERQHLPRQLSWGGRETEIVNTKKQSIK